MTNIRTDEELVKLAIAGDNIAFGEIVKKYNKLMYGLCYRILRNQTLAEEAVQESFVKLWKNLKNWKQEFSSLSTWIYKITANTCIDHRRKSIRLAEQELDENFATDFDTKSFEKNDLAEFVEDLMLKLSEPQQMCLNLYYKEELKQQEIAKVMNISVKAVESHLLRGKRKLAEILEKKNIKLQDIML